MLFLSRKNGGVRPKNWNFLDKFGMAMPVSDTYCLVECAHVSLKIATKGSLRGKKALKI